MCGSVEMDGEQPARLPTGPTNGFCGETEGEEIEIDRQAVVWESNNEHRWEVDVAIMIPKRSSPFLVDILC